MSHFSTIKTQIKEKPLLIEALQLLQYNVKEDQTLHVGGTHGVDHPTFDTEVSITSDIGFRWNKNTESYELVTDLETWNQNISVDRFIDKVTQQYARVTIHNTMKNMGFEVAEEWEMDDNSIEITVNRWV